VSMAILLRADGTEETVTPKNGTDFKLEELQGFVGGYIEIVSYFWTPQSRRRHRGKILVINEEGKLNGLPHNLRASEIYDAPFDVIVGDALLCEEGEVQ
jgi:hypothetical protein